MRFDYRVLHRKHSEERISSMMVRWGELVRHDRQVNGTVHTGKIGMLHLTFRLLGEEAPTVQEALEIVKSADHSGTFFSALAAEFTSGAGGFVIGGYCPTEPCRFPKLDKTGHAIRDEQGNMVYDEDRSAV